MALAGTIFSGKGTDELVTEDVYSIDSSSGVSMLSDLGSSLSNITGELTKALKNDRTLITDLLAVSKGVKNGDNALTSMLKLKSALGPSVVNALGTAGTDIANAMGVSSKMTNMVKATFGDSTKVLRGDVESVRGIAAMSNVLLGGEVVKVMDLQTNAAVLTSVIQQSNSMGLTGLAAMVSDDVNNQEIADYALRSGVVGTVTAGSFEGLGMIADRLTGDDILGEEPRVFNQMLANYNDPSVTVDKYDETATQIKSTFSKVDTDWDKTSYGGTSVTDLGVFANVSPDAKKILSYDNDYRDVVAVAELYQPTDVKSLVKSMYGSTVLG